MSIYKLRIDNKGCNITYLPFCGQNSRLSLAITNKYVEKDKKPWFSVMGEFHFSRYSEKSWEKELLKMKSGGVEIISTEVFFA